MRLAFGILAAGLLAFAAQPAGAQVYSIAIPGGVKVCSAVVPGNWRNDLPVPRAWTQAMCASWASTIGAGNGKNFACLTDAGIQYDFQGGNWNSCGW